MTVLHATEPATRHLSLLARVDGLTVADVDRALYDDRTLVKQLAMRRTLFVFPRDLLPAAWGVRRPGSRRTERARMAKDVVTAGLTNDGDAWLDARRRRGARPARGPPDGLLGTRPARALSPSSPRPSTVSAGVAADPSRAVLT